MEHIIQFAVSVDDARIAELATEAAAKELVRQYKKKEGDDFYGYAGWVIRLKRVVTDEIVKDILGSGMDDVVEEVATRAIRSKTFREKVAIAIASREDGGKDED